MPDSEKHIDVRKLSVPIVTAVVVGIALASGGISGMTVWFQVNRTIDALGFRLSALEGAKDEGTELRLRAVEKRLDEIANNDQVTDWNRWRARVDGLIVANATSAAQNQGRIIGLEVDVKKLQDDLRDLMRRRPPNNP